MHRTGRIVWSVFLVIVFVCFIKQGLNRLATTESHEEIRMPIQVYKEHRREGDSLYVFYGAIPQFRYYTQGSNLAYVRGSENRGNPEAYIEELEGLKGKARVWFLFSHDIKGERNQIFIPYLEENRTRLAQFDAKGASIYLYN